MKKRISLLLVFALIVSTVICAFPLSAVAETAPNQQWLDFESIELEKVDSGWIRWGDIPSTSATTYMTTSTDYITNYGYALIRQFVAPESGTLRFDTATWSTEANAVVDAVGITGGNQYTGDLSVSYAITDGSGKILYPTDGRLGSVSYNNPADPISKDAPFTAPVEEGDVFNFILINERQDGAMPMSFTGRLSIYNIIDGVYSENPYSKGVLCADDYDTQGEGGWYYKYAKSVNVTSFDPNGATDLGKEKYSASYTLNELELTYNEASPNAGEWKDPNGTTLAAWGSYAYPTATRDVVCRYTAPADGDFNISYGVLQLAESSVGTVDFFVADNDGNVIWPADGGVFHLEQGNVDKAQSVFPLDVPNMKKGDNLDFVFCNRGANSYGGVWLIASATFNGARVTNGAGGFYNQLETDTLDTMLYYTDDLEITKEINSPWSEFIISQNALVTAPQTVEAWVNIPTTVADDKVSIIIGDMDDGDTNGFSVMMAQNGAPAMIVDGGEVNFTVADVDLRTGTWQHIAFVRDTVADTTKFYLNGVLQGTNQGAGTGTVTGKNFVIGNDNLMAATTAFQGQIKGLSLWSDARTAGEITADVTSISASAEGLIGYYKLIGANNGVYTDSSASKNNCVVTTANTDWYAGTPEAAADDEQTIVHIGDTQMLTGYYQGKLPLVTQWIADNKDKLNIEFVVQTGDLVNNENIVSQWEDGKAATNILETNSIPYLLTLGNHEYPSSGHDVRNSSLFNQYYPFANYQSNLGGYYEEGKMDNVYYFHTIANTEYMILTLENEPRAGAVEWAKQVVSANPTKKVIVLTHSYIQPNGSLMNFTGCHTGADVGYSSQRLYDEFISQYANISMVLCGHVSSNDISTRIDVGVHGNKITTIMNDPSYTGEGGAGTIALYRFKTDGTVKVEYYSPLKQGYYGTENQFSLNLNKVDKHIDMSSIEEMEYRPESGVYFKKSWSLPYTANSYFNTYANYNVVYKHVAQNDYENIIFTLAGLYSPEANAVEFAVCKGDGTPLYPADGSFEVLPQGAANQITRQFTISSLKKGESINIIFNSVDKVNGAAHTGYFSYYSSVGINSNGNTAGVQGTNGYYFCTGLSDQMIIKNSSHNVIITKSLKGGTVNSSSNATVNSGNTSVITIAPDFGYRIGAVWVNGKYVGKVAKYTLNNASKDNNIRVIFESIVPNDIDGDGTVDIADTVAAYDYSKTEKTTDLCATAGDMDNNRRITVEDIHLLKQKILGITNYQETLDFSDQIENGVLKLSDCGVKANSPFDSSTLIQSALVTVAENPGAELEFDEGIYYVSQGSANENSVFDLSSYDVNELKINGNGATIMMMDNFVGCFNLANCDNVVIENMNFECAENPWVQGEVTAYNVNTREMTLSLYSDDTILDDPRMAERADTVIGMVRNKDNPYLLKSECNNFFRFDSYQKLANKQYKFTLSTITDYLTNRHIEVGDKIIINNRGGHSDFVFDAIGAGNITLNNINIYSTAGGGIVGAKNNGDIKLNNFRMTIKEGSENWICANSDGIHMQGNTGAVTVENSEFSYLADDAINLYQWYSDTVNVISASQIDVISHGTVYKAGDTVEVVEKATGNLLGTVKLASVRYVNGNTRLVFETAVNGLELGQCSGKYYVYALANTMSGSSITGTTFSYIRGRGMLLRTTDMLIENNTFSNISNHALEAWFNGDEGYSVNNLTFRGNTVNNVAYLDVDAATTQNGAVSISIYGDNNIQSSTISHDTIVIDNNVFTDYHGCAVNIGNACNVTIINNEFTVSNPIKQYTTENALHFNFCDGVTVNGNTFNDARESITAAIRYDADTVTNITIGENQFACAANKQVVTY